MAGCTRQRQDACLHPSAVQATWAPDCPQGLAITLTLDKPWARHGSCTITCAYTQVHSHTQAHTHVHTCLQQRFHATRHIAQLTSGMPVLFSCRSGASTAASSWVGGPAGCGKRAVLGSTGAAAVSAALSVQAGVGGSESAAAAPAGLLAGAGAGVGEEGQRAEAAGLLMRCTGHAGRVLC